MYEKSVERVSAQKINYKFGYQAWSRRKFKS